MKIKWDPRKVFTADPGALQDLRQAPSLHVYFHSSHHRPKHRASCILLHRVRDAVGARYMCTGSIHKQYSYCIYVLENEHIKNVYKEVPVFQLPKFVGENYVNKA